MFLEPVVPGQMFQENTEQSQQYIVHLYLCKHGIYQEIFKDLLNKGYDLKKIDISHCFTDTKDIAAKKGNIGDDGYKKIKGVKLSFLVDLKELPLSLTIAPANQYDSKLYISTLEISRLRGMLEGL